MKAPKKAKKKAKLSAEDRLKIKIKLEHIRSVRAVFRNLGFDRVSEIAEKEVTIGGQKGEIDDAFLYENVLLVVEYTTTQSADVKSHLKGKKIFFSNMMSDTKAFLSLLRAKSGPLEQRLGSKYHPDQYIVKLIYCSRYTYDEGVKAVVNEPIYFDYRIVKYFQKIAGTIKKSALSEMLAFLDVKPADVGREGILPKPTASETYRGSILAESSSGFPSGYKVVSFYVDAAALLARAYVLRRDGWRGSFQAYQRMVQPAKIEAIRKKLKGEQRVFVNNIIATLPPDVQPEQSDGTTADISKLTKTEPVVIRLPLRPNSIGLIDGQHRLYSYYESRQDDPQIAKLRHQQNLLLTGIIYPKSVKAADRERFEARLFLSINSNQTNASTSLRQEIEVLLTPFSPTAIGRQVVARLAESGPLAGYVERYFFEKGMMKTSSIVSYGLAPLIKLGGTDSLFRLFHHAEKGKIAEGKSDAALEAYLKFAVTKITIFLNAVKANVPAARWTSDPATKDRLLTVTYMNSFLITLRRLVEKKHPLDFEKLRQSLEGINTFNFKTYHSSQYARMAEQIYNKYFASA